MKILKVTAFFSPLHGGSAEVPYQLAKALAKRGHQVTVYTGDYKLGLEYIHSSPEIEVHPFKTWLGMAKFYITPGIINKAREEIRRFNVVHLHNYRTFQNIIVFHYIKKYGVPYVLQAHGSLPRIMSRQKLKQMYDNIWGYRLLKGASRVIAVTKVEAEQYKSMGVSEDKVEIIPHGIDLSEFDNLPARGGFRKKYGLSDSEKIILYLGRIDTTKGLDLLAKTFTGLSKGVDNARLVITGPDDGYLPALKKLIKELKIEEKVLFTGPLYGQDKLNAYVDADVYVLPSFYEIFGITVLEALACGTPVIITDRCGLADVINGQVGLVVPYDQDQLQDALLRLLTDDDLREGFGKRGKSLVRKKFNWTKIAEQVEKMYQEILS